MGIEVWIYAHFYAHSDSTTFQFSLQKVVFVQRMGEVDVAFLFRAFCAVFRTDVVAVAVFAASAAVPTTAVVESPTRITFALCTLDVAVRAATCEHTLLSWMTANRRAVRVALTRACDRRATHTCQRAYYAIFHTPCSRMM